MKKRLRKKLHKGEFQELGFDVSFDYVGPDDEESRSRFWDDFIGMIEALVLEVGGGGDRHLSFFVVRYRGSVTPEQRHAVIDWLEKYENIANPNAGPLKDAWN